MLGRKEKEKDLQTLVKMLQEVGELKDIMDEAKDKVGCTEALEIDVYSEEPSEYVLAEIDRISDEIIKDKATLERVKYKIIRVVALSGTLHNKSLEVVNVFKTDYFKKIVELFNKQISSNTQIVSDRVVVQIAEILTNPETIDALEIAYTARVTDFRG